MLKSRSERVAASVSSSDKPGDVSEAQPRPSAGPRLVVSNDETDAMLVRSTLDGDRHAVQTLVLRHLSRAVATAQGLLGNNASAEDIAQEAFVRLWNRLGDLEVGGAGVWPWLRRVVFNLCMDRRRARREVVPDALEMMRSSDDQHHDLEASDMARRVDSALQELPERQSAAIVLFHYEGYSVKEIAETMDSNADAVESLLGRARRALKSVLKHEWQELLPDQTAEHAEE